MRILTETEQGDVKRNIIYRNGPTIPQETDALLKTQAALTQREERKAIGEWLKHGLLLLADNGDYSSGIDAFGIDEGRVKAGELLDKYHEDIDAFLCGKWPE